MRIIDVTGKEIAVSNLPAAIEEAAFFMGIAYAEQTPEAIAASNEQQSYWSDIYQKLLELQAK
jgi:hypothetical protein